MSDAWAQTSFDVPIGNKLVASVVAALKAAWSRPQSREGNRELIVE
jgi:hypothetical protein